MRTRCVVCGAIHEIEAKTDEDLKTIECPTCRGTGLNQVRKDYGLGQPRHEKIKRWDDTEGSDTGV